MSDFPDYEAAQRAQDAGRAAVSIVDAALGDKALMQETECEHGAVFPHCTKEAEGSCPYTMDRRNPEADCRCEAGSTVYVWPQEDNDE